MRLFPAHAGVILDTDLHPLRKEAFPRPRGGDPFIVQMGIDILYFSPPTRG